MCLLKILLIVLKKNKKERNHSKKHFSKMSSRGKKITGEMKLDEVAGGSTTPEKRRLEMTEDDSGGAKGRQSVIDETMESSNMKFSPTKAGRSPTEVGPSPKKGKSNVTTEKHHMKVKVFQVLWDRINTTTELVTVQNVPSKDLTSGLKGR
jgi:hypothetical protein